MRIKFKGTALAGAIGALAIAVPAVAHPGGNHPTGPGNHPSKTNQSARSCKPHNVAFIVHGTIPSPPSPQPAITVSNGAASGTLEIDVTRTNHWAHSDLTASQPSAFTLAGTPVDFDEGTSGFSPGERVTLIGKIEVVRSHGKNVCLNSGPQGAPTFRKVVVTLAESSESPEFEATESS